MNKSNHNRVSPSILLGVISFLLASCAKQDGNNPRFDLNTRVEKKDLSAATIETRKAGTKGFLLEYSGFLIPAVSNEAFKLSDFNGDAIKDSVFLLRVVSVPKTAEGLKLVNVFEEPAIRSDSSMALGISFGTSASGPVYPHYLIFGSDFFSSPIWMTGKPWELIRMIQISNPGVDSALDRIPGRKGDLIGLYSESSAEIFLYFDGAGFKSHWPGDAP